MLYSYFIFKKKHIFLVAFFSCVFFAGYGQQKVEPKKQRWVQFSGVVVEGDSLKPLPFTSIVVMGTTRGTVSDFYGFYTLVAQPGDLIEFVNIGYRDIFYTIPDTLKASSFSLIQRMNRDTVLLQEIAVYPWPSKEEFRRAFLKLNVPNNDLARAQKNLAAEEMRQIMRGISMDAQGNYSFAMQQQYAKLYYAGQYPTNNLLNPIAWANFIKAWRNGKLKRQ